MYIKKLAIILSSLFLLSCAGEDVAYLDTKYVKVEGAGCLATSLKKFDYFFKGEMKNAEVAAFWGCLDTTLKSVKRYMQGDGAGGAFKKVALGKFVSKHFLKSDEPDGVVLTPALLHQVMVLKTLFLGGDTELLKPVEIENIFQIFTELSRLTVQLNPHMSVLFNNNKGIQPSANELSKAVTALEKAIKGLGQLLARHQIGYKVSDFETFARELHLAIGDPNDPTQVEWLKYLPAFQEIKNQFMLTSKDQVEYDEWIDLTDIVASSFGIYYRSKYFLNLKSLLSLSTVSEIPNILNHGYDILKEALDRREDSSFSTADFTAVINALDEHELLPELMSADDLIHTWEIFVDKVFVVDDRDFNPGGFGIEELNYAKSIWMNWNVAQKYLLGSVKNPNDEGILDLNKFLDLPWEFKLDAKGRLIFDERTPGRPDLNISTEINLYRVAFNALVKAYSAQNMELNEGELQVATTDLKPLLVQLGLVGKDDNGFHKTLFLYSNLFLPFSNGDDKIDSREITYFVYYVFSAETASNIFNATMQAECQTAEPKVFEVKCFREQFEKEYANVLQHLPHMVNFINSFEKKKHWKEFLGDFESAVIKDITPEDHIRSVEIGEIFMLMQFIETIMMTYDADWDYELNLEEGLKALDERFQYQISIILDPEDPMSPEDVEVLFTYLLKYGEAPNPKKPLSLLRYLWWKWNKKNWKIEANRGTIVKILSSLNSLN